MSKLGIDVSKWQKEINWAEVKKSGVEFAIIKAGGSDDGFYEDRLFEQNYAGAKEVGIPVGAYYFVGPNCIGVANGVADAERFIELLKGKKFEYPVYLDYEAPDASNISGNTEAAIGFCETMEAAGYYVGIYASDISGFKDRLNIDALNSYDKWVAIYGCEPRYVKEYGIWQYSSEEKIDGIATLVDANYAYKDYPSIIKNGGFNGFDVDAPVESPAEEPEAPVDTNKKSCVEIAKEIWIMGNWGNGQDRINNLKAASYSDDEINTIQGLVDKLAKGEPVVDEPVSATKKSCEEIANEIWTLGNWGNGQDRIDNLKAAGYSDEEINTIQSILNNK